MILPFRVTLKGYFYSLELYDQKGRSVYDIAAAIQAANDEYGQGWDCVYNGEECYDQA